MNKILLVGCGHMGSALLSSWLASNKYNLTVVDPVKYNFLKTKFKKKIQVYKNISSLNKKIKFNFIILAVRPVELNFVLQDLSKIKLTNSTTIISVIAGKKIELFKKKFKNNSNIFRIMPNMSAVIGESMNCIASSSSASNSQKKKVVKLFSYSGKTLLFSNEKQIDMATAVSGSGPGFVFNLIDSFENAAISLGFKKNIAKLLVLQTFKGSIDLLIKNKLTAKEMVQKVATKGGTTEAGLKVMQKNNIQKIFRDLTKVSYKKAKDQGK